MSQRELATAVEAHEITISKLERGQMRLTQNWMNRLALVFKVDPADLISDGSLVRSVFITGVVKSSGSVHDIRDIIGKNADDVSEFVVDFGLDPSEKSRWIMVITDAYGPIARIGDLMRFSEYSAGANNELLTLGRLVLAKVVENDAEVIGTLERGISEGVVDVRLPDGSYKRRLKVRSLLFLRTVIGLPELSSPPFDLSRNGLDTVDKD